VCPIVPEAVQIAAPRLPQLLVGEALPIPVPKNSARRGRRGRSLLRDRGLAPVPAGRRRRSPRRSRECAEACS
jgi:hypothetical protein